MEKKGKFSGYATIIMLLFNKNGIFSHCDVCVRGARMTGVTVSTPRNRCILGCLPLSRLSVNAERLSNAVGKRRQLSALFATFFSLFKT